MSEFLDEFARMVAMPLPRRRALRLLGGALLGVAVPGIATTRARAGSGFHTCVKDGGRLCQCPAGRGLFYKICCTPKDEYECKCKGPPDGYAACKRCPGGGKACGHDGKCCPPGQHCTWPRKAEGFPSNGVCCPKGQLGCGKDGPGGGADWTFCCPPGKVCGGTKGSGHCVPSTR